jgi:hypothetical protein
MLATLACTGRAADNHSEQPGCLLYPSTAAQQSTVAGGLLNASKKAKV